MWILLLVGCVLGLIGGWLLWLSRRAQRKTGLPVGEIIYRDTANWQPVEQPLISQHHGLIGKPDYLIRQRLWWRSVIIPVEVKSRRRPATPRADHVLQLMTYCLLVEDCLGQRPPYGLLHYADASVRIPYTNELRRQVLAAAQEIREGQQARTMARSHQQSARCQQCGYAAGCGDQRLASQAP
jgi:CRISPR-associated exonuclease Cas4